MTECQSVIPTVRDFVWQAWATKHGFEPLPAKDYQVAQCIILHPASHHQLHVHSCRQSQKCTQAVQTAKDIYDPTLPLKLVADASQYGLGAIISHVLPGDEEKPIAFASRSLSKSEQNYGQIDKEALALIYGVQKFHTYIFGRKFTPHNYPGPKERNPFSSRGEQFSFLYTPMI